MTSARSVRLKGRRRTLFRLGLLLLGTLLGLGAGEVLCRIFWNSLRSLDQVDIRYPLVMPAVFTGAEFGFMPNREYVGVYDGDPSGNLPADHRVVYRTNELGFRDEPFGPRISEDGLRVLLLGDSFALGEGVAEPERFGEIAGERAAEALGTRVLVFNAAVSGYCSMDESIAARQLVPYVRPKAVLLSYCLNDPKPLFSEGYPGFDLIVGRDNAPEGEWASPFRLVELIRQRLRLFRLTRSTLSWYEGLYEGEGALWNASRHSLVEMRDTAARGGAKFGIVLFPLFYHVGGAYPFEAAHRTIVSWCREHGIPVLDTQPLFEGMEDSDLVVHPKDHHPNARAHAIVGERTARFLVDEVLGR